MSEYYTVSLNYIPFVYLCAGCTHYSWHLGIEDVGDCRLRTGKVSNVTAKFSGIKENICGFIPVLFYEYKWTVGCEFDDEPLSIEASVTRFGENSPLCQNFTSLWQLFGGLFLIWQNSKPTLAKLLHCFWANFHCWKWPNIET